MPKFRMLLVERQVLGDSGEFYVEAKTAEEAAQILIDARDKARDNDSNEVELSDGQMRYIEPNDILESRVFCVLLNDRGEKIKEVDF